MSRNVLAGYPASPADEAVSPAGRLRGDYAVLEPALQRVGLPGLTAAAGAFAGNVANGNRTTLIGALVGALLALIGVLTFDALRGWRLLRWLRSAHEAAAPRDRVNSRPRSASAPTP